MDLSKKTKIDIYKVLMCVLSIILLVLGTYTFRQNAILKIDTEGLAMMETVNSNVQRQSKLNLEDATDEDLLLSLVDMTSRLLPLDGESIYFANNAEITELIESYINDLALYQIEIEEYRVSGDRNLLFIASENNYKTSISKALLVSDYIQAFTEEVDQLEMYLIIVILLLGLTLVKILLNTMKELKINKELSKEMFIDTSTGLYNRSKCQEILKSPVTLENNKERAVIIFDLNDLKKTNDGLGHRAGDELISSFAAQLKKATEVFAYEVFVGRYGGDEFMAYFASCEEADIELYLKEVDYQLEHFNDTEGKPFKLSCAAGYCITTEATKAMTMRELFDLADETMYKNKLAMKAKKRQEMLDQGIEIEEVVDDRL